MWRNDTKCKYMFMFPLKNSARKGLRYWPWTFWRAYFILKGKFVKLRYSINVILIMRYLLELYFFHTRWNSVRWKTSTVNVSCYGEILWAPLALKLTKQVRVLCYDWQPGINSLRPRQNGRLFADDTLKCIFLNENVRISIKISLKVFFFFFFFFFCPKIIFINFICQHHGKVLTNFFFFFFFNFFILHIYIYTGQGFTSAPTTPPGWRGGLWKILTNIGVSIYLCCLITSAYPLMPVHT